MQTLLLKPMDAPGRSSLFHLLYLFTLLLLLLLLTTTPTIEAFQSGGGPFPHQQGPLDMRRQQQPLLPQQQQQQRLEGQQPPAPLSTHTHTYTHPHTRQLARRRPWQMMPLAAGGGGFGKKPSKEGAGGEGGKGDGKKKKQQDKPSSDSGPSIVKPTFSQRGVASTTIASTATPAEPPPRKFQMLYTCNLCEGRNLITVDRVAFTEGIVVARCKTCDAKHLVADNLSKLDFGEGKVTLDDILALRGEKAQKLDPKTVDPNVLSKYDLEVLEDGTVEMTKKEGGGGAAEK